MAYGCFLHWRAFPIKNASRVSLTVTGKVVAIDSSCMLVRLVFLDY